MHDPKHIVITGASSGIGAALALAYAAPGVQLSLQGRHADRLNAIAAKAEKRGAAVTIKLADVTDGDTIAGWLMSCERMAPVDLVIANAGVSAGTGGAHESDEQARTIFATNLSGVLNTVQPMLSVMARRGRGQIAIMSSLAGFRGIPGAPAYSASKAAVRLYGEALRWDMKQQGVSINVICPGFVKTPMTDVNTFPMPLIMEADEAAAIIRRGLAADCARIAFPFVAYAFVRLGGLLPMGLMDALMSRMPRKGTQR